MRLFFLSFFCFSLLFFEAKSSENLSGKELKQIINSWLYERGYAGEIKILDNIKYPACDNSNLLITDISGSYNLIKASCLGPNQWSFITRNKTKKNIPNNNKNNNEVNIVSLKVSKPAGSMIKEDDLVFVQKRVHNSRGLILKKREIVGRKLKRSSSPGAPIYQSNLEKDWLIEKNSPIIIENKIGSIIIKEEGVALDDANYMEKIRVKNIKSGKIIYGFAKNQKKVVIRTKQN